MKLALSNSNGPGLANRNIVTVIGLGRVGLPHALLAAEAGNCVIGVDSDRELVQNLSQGRLPFKEPGMHAIAARQLNKNFHPTSDILGSVEKSDTVVVMINLLGNRGSNLERLVRNLGKRLREKNVILRSTVTIGTTDKMKALIERETGLREHVGFSISYVPERVAEGRVLNEEQKLPKIIGAYSDLSFDRAANYFRKIGGSIIRVSSPKVAELVKLVDNSYRSVRFGFVNDLALLSERMGIDILEVVKASNQEYERNDIPLPSYGVSGTCLSKDPHLLEDSFRSIALERGFHSMWHISRRANDYLAKHVASIVCDFAGRYKRNYHEVNIGVAGLSYKENIDDFRMSHGMSVALQLAGTKKFSVSAYDPYARSSKYSVLPEQVARKVKTYDRLTSFFERKDIIFFSVKHREFLRLANENDIRSLIEIMRSPSLIIDGWNMFWKLKHLFSKWGAQYRGCGVRLDAGLSSPVR